MNWATTPPAEQMRFCHQRLGRKAYLSSMRRQRLFLFGKRGGGPPAPATLSVGPPPRADRFSQQHREGGDWNATPRPRAGG